MTTRYTQEQIDDVAHLLDARSTHEMKRPDNEWTVAMLTIIATDFADLFAADNPPIGKPRGGFDRARFLAACGLEVQPQVRK